jgi:excisionase family DNA binding protein
MTPADNNVPRLLLRPQEAANSLGISLRSLMAMVAANEVPFTRIGERCLRFSMDGLRDWVAKRTTWPTELVPVGPENCGAGTGNHGGGDHGGANQAATRHEHE